MGKLLLFFTLSLFTTKIGFGQFIINPSFEGPPSESIPPPGWFGCNLYSTPDTQPGTWMVGQAASEGNTYISLVTRGYNGDPNDGYAEAISTLLEDTLHPAACYQASLDLAYSSAFDDGLTARQGTWRPIKLKVWAFTGECKKGNLLWTSSVVSNEEWQTYPFNFTVDQHYSALILEADYADGSPHNGNILVDNIQLSSQETGISDVALCANEPITLQVDFPDSAVVWSAGAEAAATEISEAGTYWVRVNTGECLLTDTFRVSYPKPLAIELGGDVVKCLGDSLTLGVSAENANFLWNTGSRADSITVKESGTYTVRVDNGCEYVEDAIDVVFAEQCCLISAPNVFTPNGDSVNDYFEITSGAPIGRYQLQVYNRWGKLVYESSALEQLWDGFTPGNYEASPGVYYWQVNILCVRGLEITDNTFKGTVTLLR